MRLSLVVTAAAGLVLVACRGDDAADGAGIDPGAPPSTLAGDDVPADATIASDAAAPPEDAGPVAEHVPFEPPRALPPGECAPPAGEWLGTASVAKRDTLARYFVVRGDVTWRLASTEGCVDHYVPSGTATIAYEVICYDVDAADRSRPIGSDDGEMIVDRSTVPPTFHMRGETRWTAGLTLNGANGFGADCDGYPQTRTMAAGGTWVEIEGELAGDAFGARLAEPPENVQWLFTRVGATAPSPDGICVEPPVDRWAAYATAGPAIVADLDWTRISTAACMDVFKPSGTAVLQWMHPECVEEITTPDRAPIESDDGTMWIDRSTWPVSVRVFAGSRWPAEWRCTRADGTVETNVIDVRATWMDDLQLWYGGDRFAGSGRVDGRAQTWAAQKL